MALGSPAIALAVQLERVLRGDATLDHVFAAHSEYGAALADCFHGLQHFNLDHALRESDPEYRAMQEAEMRRLIYLLKAGASGAALRTVHFLGRSGNL